MRIKHEQHSLVSNISITTSSSDEVNPESPHASVGSSCLVFNDEYSESLETLEIDHPSNQCVDGKK